MPDSPMPSEGLKPPFLHSPDVVGHVLPKPNLQLFAVAHNLVDRLRPKNLVQTAEYAAVGGAAAAAAIFAVSPDTRQAVFNMLAKPFGTDIPPASVPAPPELVVPTPTQFPVSLAEAPSPTPVLGPPPKPSETETKIADGTATPPNPNTPTVVATETPTPDYVSRVQTQIKSMKLWNPLPILKGESKTWKTNPDYGFEFNDNGSLSLFVNNGSNQEFQINSTFDNNTIGIITQFDDILDKTKINTKSFLFLASGQDYKNFNHIYIRKFHSPVVNKDYFNITYENWTDGKFTGLPVTLDPSNPNPRLLMYFPPGMNTFQLIELSLDEKSGRILSAVNLADLKDQSGKTIFPDGVFTHGHDMYAGFDIEKGDRINVNEFSEFFVPLKP